MKATWQATRINGLLTTTGIMILAGHKLIFKPIPGYEAAATVFCDNLNSAQAAGCTPENIFTYTVESGNGMTEDWSAPFEPAGVSPEVVAANLIAAAVLHRM